MSVDSSAAQRRAARGIELLVRRFDLPAVDVAALWRIANDEIAARLLLAAAREELCAVKLRTDALEIAGVVVPLAHEHALGLHAREVGVALGDPILHWSRIADTIGCDAATTSRIAAELDDGRARLVLAELATRTRDVWLARLAADDPRRHDAEHFVTRGHPWHPMVKTRMGLGWADNVRLAPELCARAVIDSVVLPASVVRTFGDDDALAAAGITAVDDHVQLPMLRAQWHRLASPVRARMARAAGPARVGRTLASLRTVALDESAIHVKLALDVLTTSARRTVSPMSVANATEVSALLERIQAGDAHTRGTLVIMREVASAGLATAAFGADARQLGVIVRDASVLDPSCIVCAAIGERDEHGEPYLDRLLAGYAGAPAERADALLVDYAGQLVPPLLRLWTAHGIALEPHMQNTLVRLRADRPAGFVVRDLGGIRIHRPRLARAGHSLAFEPGSFIATDDEAEASDKLAHALVHAHLAALLRELVARCGYAEAVGWRRIGDVIDACLRAWSAAPGLTAAVACDRARLFAPRVRAKALLRMRIDDRSSEYRYLELANPLARDTAPIDQPTSAT